MQTSGVDLPTPADTPFRPIVLNVRGHPRPQPRPRFVRGRVISTLDPNARLWRGLVEREARGILTKTARQAILKVGLVFRIPSKDKSRHNRFCASRPDADNLAKLALDAFMDAGLIADDSAVAELHVVKLWSAPGDAGMSATISQAVTPPAPPPDPARPDWV